MALETEPEKSFKFAWDEFKAERSFSERSRRLLLFWTKDLMMTIGGNDDNDAKQDHILKLIRLHQLHVIDPKWVEDVQNRAFRDRLADAVVAADKLIAGRVNSNVYQEYKTLVEIHKDPWTGSAILPIISGTPDYKSIDYLLGESFIVCLKRFEIMLTSIGDRVALNYSDFLVSNIFSSDKRDSSPIVRRWLDDADRRGEDVTRLLDAHLGFVYKIGRESKNLDKTLKVLDIEDLMSMAERALARTRKLSGDVKMECDNSVTSTLDDLWSEETSEACARKVCELAVYRAAKSRLDHGLLDRILGSWLDLFIDPKDSDLDLDVEKFGDLGVETALGYEIAFRIYQKFGQDVRALCVDTFNRRLAVDINRLNVAQDKNDVTIVKQTEENLSRGLILLSQVLKENLTMERECILTAFSLTPTEGLLKHLTQLAERSGFVNMGLTNPDSSNIDDVEPLEKVPVPLSLNPDDFETVCELEIASLKNKGFRHGRSKFRANASVQEKVERNLEGLVSIQGDLITNALNYDPSRRPLSTLTPKALGLPKDIVADLLTVVEAPRWHILTWVLDWHTLEEKCLELLKTPEKKKTKKDLEYLVIDYTQFDDWSSDEEIVATTGIEKGYENWDVEVDDDKISEHGLSGDETNNLEFNIVQKFEGEEDSDFDEDDIPPEQYLPKRWKEMSDPTTRHPPETKMDVDDGNVTSSKNHFLAAAGETEAASSDLAGSQVPEGLLRNNDNNSTTSEQVRQTLREVVPGLDNNPVAGICQPPPQNLDVRSVHLSVQPFSFSESRDPRRSNEVRQTLRELVPGLTDFSFWSDSISPDVRLDVGVVHVTLANSSQSSSSSGVTSSSGNIGQTGSTRKVVLESSSQPVESSTSSNLQSSVVPIKKENEQQQQQQQQRETKIQYVYKHGTQTIVVDRPLTEEELSKLKFPLPNNRVQQQQQQQVAGHQTKQAIVVAARPSVVSQPAAVARIVVPSASAASSVDTLANTLISQIQTPVQLTPTGQPIKVEDQKPSPGTLPKFQFAFGSGQNPNSAGGGPPVVKTEPGLVVVKSEPLEASTNGKLVLTSAQIAQMAQKGNLITTKLGQPQMTSQQIVVGGMTSVQNTNPILSGQVTLQTTASPSAASHADLIRQLNLARAQGLVVLQQWGDKQVLVHKATGRWIMRQGNRLVTVPPQALGIQAVAGDQSCSTASTTTTSTTVSTPNNLMSSSTMEQLREFDSILESKFKTTTSINDDTSSPRQVVATSGSSPATFVIIAPHQQQQFTTSSSSNGGVTPTVVKVEPGLDFTQVKTMSMTTTSASTTSSSSAPTSPAKPVKVPQSSISASASPLGSGNSSLGFAKPSPKPQEDPDTLKRIQQILDDYNEQIRNSPDLQNRPAPRRRTNGPTIVNTTDPVNSNKRKRLSSVSPPPSSMGCDSDVGSPSVVQISPANVLEPGQITTTLKVVQHHSKSPSENGDDQMSGYSVVRQIVVPPSLAASLQASGRQIMVVTGPGGKKMVALKPLYVSAANSPNLVNKFVTVSSGLPSRLITSTTTSSSGSSSNASSPDTSSSNSASMAKALAALKSAVPVSIGSTSITSLSSSPVRPPNVMMPSFVVTSSASNVTTQHITSSQQQRQPNVVVVSSPNVVLSSSSSATTTSSSNHERASPSPILVMQTAVTEERPGTPGLGIPMEMTPGQIMEAEISAATLLDDNPDSPFALLSSASSSSLRRRKHEDEESLSETLPENLFTQDLPGTSSEDDEDEDDHRYSDIYDVSTTTTSKSVYGKRQRNMSSTSSAEELSHIQTKKTRLEPNLGNGSLSTGNHHPTGNGSLKSSRVRNLSKSKSSQVMGICIDSSQLINN